MNYTRFTVKHLAGLLVLCVLAGFGCTSGHSRAENRTGDRPDDEIARHEPEVVFETIVIRAGRYNTKIINALDLLKNKEPDIFLLMKNHIRIVQWEGNPFWSLTHFPDRVSLSTRSLTRGRIYCASLLYHELNHILFFKIRLSPAGDEPVDACRYLKTQGVIPSRIRSIPSFDEEKAIHLLQLDFLIRHRDYKMAEMQKVIIENLPKTYRHLRR